MFYYEQMFDTALRGIATAGLMSTVLTVAYGILLVSLLFGAYEAWVKGGDVRALGIAGVKYLALGSLFMNDGVVYERVFREVLGVFNQISRTMAGASSIDVFNAWRGDLFSYASSSGTLLNLVAGGVSGLLSALLLLIALIIYPVAYALFAVLYSLYGSILFVCGPLVLAFMPSFGLGSFARRYAVNVMIFASWGLIYGIFCRLAITINVHSMGALSAANGFAGVLAGASQEVLLAVASVLFSVCILLIPFLAKRIVEGDAGSSMLAVLGTATTMVQSLASVAAGPAAGFSSVAGGGAESAGASAAAASSGSAPMGPAASSTSSGTGRSHAPSGPGATPGPGNHRPPNLPHAVGWMAGAAAAVAVQGGHRAMAAARQLFQSNTPGEGA